MKSKLRDMVSDAELRVLIKSEARRYSHIIFRLLSMEELRGYYPAERFIKAARDELCLMFILKEAADAIIEYFRRREASGYKTTEELNPIDEGFILPLKEAANELGRAPLMAELDEDTAHAIWIAFGTWKGALELAEIEPLTENERECAIEEYAVKNASPSLITKGQRRKMLRTMRAFNEKEMLLLKELCDTARNLGSYMTEEDFSESFLEEFRFFSTNITHILYFLGLAKYDEEQRKAEIQRHKKDVYHFQSRAYNWRRGKKKKPKRVTTEPEG